MQKYWIIQENYIQQSQFEKGKNVTNFHYLENNKIEPKGKTIIEFEKEYSNNNIIKEEEKEKEKSTNQNTSIFSKVPSFEELKMKYGKQIGI